MAFYRDIRTTGGPVSNYIGADQINYNTAHEKSFVIGQATTLQKDFAATNAAAQSKMKTQTLLILAAVGIAAYFLLRKK